MPVPDLFRHILASDIRFPRAFLREWLCFWRFLGALALILFLATPTHATENAPISLDAYWDFLQTTHTHILELIDTPPEDARPALEALAVQWEAITAVELPDGTLLLLDPRYFTTHLRAENPDLPQLTTVLAYILANRETWPQGNFGNADLAKLDAVLRQPEFQWQPAPPNPLATLRQQLLRRINDAYQRLLDWLFPNLEGNLTLPTDLIITLAGSILLIGIFIYILRGTWGNLITEAENATNGDGQTTPLTSETARQRARQLSQAGDHRTAIRYLYLASLLLLEERGLLRYDRTLTNRETLRSVQNRPDLAAPLQEVVETFDRVWYGYQEVDAPTFEHYAERVEDLRAKK